MGRHVAGITRPIGRGWGSHHPLVTVSDAFAVRPCTGGAVVLAPLPVGNNGLPFMGMDPSDPLTHVRPWNPRPGMIALLNFDGAQAQGQTAMGGTWRSPPSQMRTAAGRPRRKAR